MGRRLEDQEGLRGALDAGVNPSEETRKLAFDTFFADTLEDMIDSISISAQEIKDDPELCAALFRAVMYLSHRGGIASGCGLKGLPLLPAPAPPESRWDSTRCAPES